MSVTNVSIKWYLKSGKHYQMMASIIFIMLKMGGFYGSEVNDK